MNSKFKDVNGKEWDLKITLGGARRALDNFGIDLLNPASKTKDGEILSSKLMSDDLFLYSVVLCLIKPQLEKAGLDANDESIDELFDAESLRGMDSAFWSAYKNFFTARGKAWAAKAIEADIKAREEALTKALEELEASDGGKFSEPSDAQASADAGSV